MGDEELEPMERERQKQTGCARTNDRTVREGKGKRIDGERRQSGAPPRRSIRTPISPPGRAITAYREWDESHPKRMGWIVRHDEEEAGGHKGRWVQPEPSVPPPIPVAATAAAAAAANCASLTGLHRGKTYCCARKTKENVPSGDASAKVTD